MSKFTKLDRRAQMAEESSLRSLNDEVPSIFMETKIFARKKPLPPPLHPWNFISNHCVALPANSDRYGDLKTLHGARSTAPPQLDHNPTLNEQRAQAHKFLSSDVFPASKTKLTPCLSLSPKSAR